MKALILGFTALLLGACATTGQIGLLDFNSRFKESIPADPQYKIEIAGINRYQIVVYQGSAVISERTTRASFLIRAGLIAMEAHCIEKGGILGEHSLQDHVDSLGYINVIGLFTCKLPRKPTESPPKKRNSIESI